MNRIWPVFALFLGAIAPVHVVGEDFVLHRFDRVPLTDVYYSEGANFGDLNHDGVMDVVHGPYWFAGPDFKQKHELYPPKSQNRDAYADNFFSWVYDFNGDGWNDVFVVGFPGTPAYVYENPAGKKEGHWTKHRVFDFVANESPHFTNLVGDEKPELICTRDGFFGYATIDAAKAFGEWTFHAISEQNAPKNFGHGLGVGDIDGDGRLDVLIKDGWFQQPAAIAEQPRWKFHAYPFAGFGGAEMYAYDVDGDGDSDVITSLQAHDFGLAWFEQVQEGGERTFRKHLIMGSKPEENKYGLVFSELHTVALADMDGDGVKDIVTGKTYWSHHRQSPMWDAGAVVYWFKLVRGKDGVDFLPFKADGEAGVGRQVVVGDLNKDGLPDIVVGGMKGAHVLLHRREKVDEATWRAAQPKAPKPLADGLPPKEAAENMTVPDGFRVQLAAGEPQIHQPIAFTIDPRGRLWVAEAYTYPNRAPDGKGQDKIVILEDTNGDGTFDSRKVFIEGLNLVSGLELGFGGVWVGAPPYLMFIPDRDGDDVPDAPAATAEATKDVELAFPLDVPPSATVLLDGFGYQDTHETLNSFIWGPDGWLYGCHGVFTHSKVGKPGTPAEERTPLNAGVWRYHPTRHQFEVFAWGTSNPWGVDFNDQGQAFITACVIPHLWHVIQGARYQRQGGQHFDPYFFDDIKTIADHAHYVGKIADHAWWGHEPKTPTDTLVAGGGHAHCGALIYLGDNFPPEYRNQLFMNNVHGNRVNQDSLERHGSGYVGHHGSDLLIANDRWFRGISLKSGPDGSVYVIDWYDKNACHRANPEIWDRTNGRIYNVKYVGTGKVVAANPKESRPADLARCSNQELLVMQLSHNEWHVRTARRLLGERARDGKLAREELRFLWQILAAKSTVPVTGQLRALWTLHHIVGTTLDVDGQAHPRGEFAALLLRLLDHPDEYLRSWAIQLELEDRQAPEPFPKKLAEMAAKDPSPMVRLYLASGLQRLSPESGLPIARALARHAEDAEDHNLPLMVWYGIERLVQPGLDPLQLAAEARIPRLARFIARRAAAEGPTLSSLVASLAVPPKALAWSQAPSAQGVALEWREMVLDEMLTAFEGRVNLEAPATWLEAYESLAKSDVATIRDRADEVAVIFGDTRVLPKLRAMLVNAKAPPEKRKQALEILVRGRDKDAAGSFQAILSDVELRGAALRALAAYDDAKTPVAVLEQYGQLTDAEKRDAISTLCSRPAYAVALLDAIERTDLPRTDLHAYNVQQLLRFDDEKLQQRIRSVWGEFRATAKDKQEQITEYKKKLKPGQLKVADLGNGRRLYSKTCASCHILFGEGGKVGPDITGSNRANLDYILENLIDPSAIVGKDYRLTVLALKDGRVVSGLVQKETDSALTVRTLNDTVVIAKSDIEDRKLSELSIMPENQLGQLKPDEVRDLVAYLASPSQVTLRGPRAPIDPKTKAVAGALEGESLKILGKTGGTAAGQSMSGFPKDRWSGNDHLWWTGAGPGAQLDLELPVSQAGDYYVEAVLTMARDYGVVQLMLDGQKLGEPIDLFNTPEVITTGVVTFEHRPIAAGLHKLSVQIVGTNPDAVKAYMCGLDYVRLVPVESAK